MAIKTLNRWTELGLFVVSEKEEVKVCDQHRSSLKKAEPRSSTIADVVRQFVLAKENNRNFWDDEENKAADFCRAAAWMLAQDVYQFVPGSYSQVEPKALEQAASSDVVFFQNDTRWSGFVSWSTFLGFGQPESGKASGGYIIDPTPAIRPAMLELLPSRGEVAIDEVLDNLASRLPLIDGGEYRAVVEERLRTEKWRPPDRGQLSSSLSRSLLRLRDAGDIRLEARSDAAKQLKLVGRNRRIIQGITHVRRGDAT